ncbi:hypothetical protein [Calothrix sp. PCC 6303]|jgi:hypothetical protein|uniref:hypothetical protein n=1 Tax=Calothrix sp. PCC 6303 TaxID=1170562 RepID=UPI0002A02EDA|nr:hypothetical protein [Calothrix sp. PCC 6303]AFZ03106.1 hypothetical protein Cal6303_4195 [Calothrix sp. PCC 6303]
MNAVLPRILKSAYRRDPIISVVMTMGLVDALIGGLDDSWSLFIFGLIITGASLGVKLWKVQQNRQIPQDEPVLQQRYLPSKSSSSASALPMLSVTKKRPPL